MSRPRNRTLRPLLLLALLAAFPASAAPAPDRVALRRGGEIRCRVLALDERQLVVEREDGRRENLPRADVLRIELGETAVKPIVARVHVVEGDDVVRLLLDGREIASPAELRAGWVDLAPLLREGPNVITAEVENRSGPWAYRWTLEAGAQRETFACGLANRAGCRQRGGNGMEQGTFPAGSAYLYVHRNAGEVVIQRD